MLMISFDEKDEVVSLISRKSIDTLSTSRAAISPSKDTADHLESVFRDQVTMDEWKMIRAMKTEQGVE